MRLLTRRRAAVLGALGVLALAGSAFAYWTGTSSGTGTGAVASTAGTVTLTGTVAAGLAPGTSEPVAFTGVNNSGSPIYVTKISMSSITVDSSHATAGCLAVDFTMADTSEGVQVPGTGSTFTFPSSGSLAMANTGVTQDACKGATLSLVLAGV